MLKPEPLTVFVVSFLSFSKIDSPSEPGLMDSYWEHAPVFLVASSLDDARSQARDIAFSTWPISKGWTHHSAVIKPVSNPLIANLQLRGIIQPDTNPLVSQTFKFEPAE